MAKKTLIVKQIKSSIGCKPKQRKNLFALGLRKINAVREHQNNAVIKGMINNVSHLIEVTEK